MKNVVFVVTIILIIVYLTFLYNKLNIPLFISHNNKLIDVNHYENVIYNSCVLNTKDVDTVDFIGHDHVMKELDIIRKAMKDPSKDLELPNTILLHGPPGTGKTTVAKQMSKSLNIDNMVLLCITMSNIENKYYGESLKLLNAVFSLSNKLENCILFFDEIDGFMTERSSLDQSHTSTMKTTLLMCIDNIIGKNNIFLIAATNRPKDLDTAFLRRMELHMELDKPTIQDKLKVGKKYLSEITEEVVLEMFDTWTLHDMNKFFRFVERRKWIDDTNIHNTKLKEYYQIYKDHYLLNKI